MNRPGVIALLRRNPDYRRLWLAELISFLGDWFNAIALYTIVYRLSGSGRAFAGVMVAKTLPIFLVSPVAGPLIDRLDRRRVMILSDVGRCVLVVGLILAHRTESLTALFATLVAMVCLTGFFYPARSAAIPQLVGEEELATANALSAGTWSVMLSVGAALGGWVTAAIGVESALALDGLTFLASAALLLRIPALPAPGTGSRRSSGSFIAGLRYLLSNRYQLALAALKPLMALSGGVIALIPVFGTSVYAGRSGPAWIGALYFARGLGALLGSIGLVRLFGDDRATLRRVVWACYAVIGLGYAAMGSASRFELAALALLLGTIGTGGIWVISSLLIQRETDRQFHGRIFSMEFGMLTLVFSAAGWIWGGWLDGGDVDVGRLAEYSGWMMVVPLLIWGGALVWLARRRAPAPQS